MKLVPLGDRVVLKQCVAEETTKSGIVIPGQSKEKPQQAEVIAVGPGGMVNGKEVENPEELEVCFIRIMYPPKTRNNLISVNNTLSIKEGISIYILSNQISLDKYVNDTYQTLSETYSDKIKKNYTKKINDKEIKVLEFSNNLIYLTQVEDNKILCIDATYLDKSKDKILNSFDSLSFN